MNEYVLLFRSTEAQRRERMGTPEQAQKTMKAWLDWMRQLETRGHLKDPGQPLDGAGKVIRGREAVVSDGPFAEAKDIVMGFTVIRAADLDQAVELARDCPILQAGSVEVRAVVPVPR